MIYTRFISFSMNLQSKTWFIIIIGGSSILYWNYAIPFLLEILTLRKTVPSSSLIVPVIVMCVLFVAFFNGGCSLAIVALKLICWVCLLTKVGLGNGESWWAVAKKGSIKSSFADNLSETFAKHFPINFWVSSSWILSNAFGSFPCLKNWII